MIRTIIVSALVLTSTSAFAQGSRQQLCGQALDADYAQRQAACRAGPNPQRCLTIARNLYNRNLAACQRQSRGGR